MHEVRGGAVDGDHSAAARGRDHIGLEPRAVGDVGDRHLLALEQIGGVHQVDVDRDRADIMEVGLGHRRPVDFRLHHHPHHGDDGSRSNAPKAGAL